MQTQSGIIRTLVALIAMLMALTAAIPLATAAPAPVPAECANGGYAAWDRGDGTPFKNENQCAKFVNNGGVLVPWVPAAGTVSVSFVPSSNDPGAYCMPVITVSGFARGTYTVAAQAIQYMYFPDGTFGYRDVVNLAQSSIVTNGSGTGSVQHGIAIMPGEPQPPADPAGTAYWYVQATVSGISSAESIVWC